MPPGVWKALGWPTIADYAGRGDSALSRPFLDTSELRWSEPHTVSGKRGKFSSVQSVHRVGGKVSFTTEQTWNQQPRTDRILCRRKLNTSWG